MSLPLNFFLLIFMIWNPCHLNLVMISSILLKYQGHPSQWYFRKSHFVAIPSICNQRSLTRQTQILVHMVKLKCIFGFYGSILLWTWKSNWQMLANAMCNLKKKKEYAFVKSLVVQLTKFFLLEKSVLLMDG